MTNYKPHESKYQFFLHPQHIYQTLTIWKGKSNPLPLAWMILDDPTTQPQALAQDLPHLLLLFFFSQNPFFSFLVSILVFVVEKGKKTKERVL